MSRLALSVMRLEHYSKSSVSEVRPEAQLSRHSRVNGKPRGFWVSVAGDDDWPAWCIGEDFRLERLTVRHLVTLTSAARIRAIASADELDAFHAEYAAGDRFAWPDWRRVATQHDGIIIAPYQWSHRLMKPASSWYYSWDCASGCIWHPRAIASIEVVESLVETSA